MSFSIPQFYSSHALTVNENEMFRMKKNAFVVYGAFTCVFFNLSCQEIERNQVWKIFLSSLFSISNKINLTKSGLKRCKKGTKVSLTHKYFKTLDLWLKESTGEWKHAHFGSFLCLRVWFLCGVVDRVGVGSKDEIDL